ncbi:MAG TPA: tetratricopeptide repeat protein [Bacteroidales bacterium]|nr:tetratricopeptide repeat protein [Bacteroidales bacterium]HSA42742.1 tetratricopeptide repeat protein [Bacteroidales bacterium]
MKTRIRIPGIILILSLSLQALVLQGYALAGRNEKFSSLLKGIPDQYPLFLLAEGHKWIDSAGTDRPHETGLGYMAIARAYMLMNQEKNAHDALSSALIILDSAKHTNSYFEALLMKAELWLAFGKYEDTFAAYMKLLDEAEEAGDTVFLIQAYNGIGIIFRVFEEYSRARDYFTEAMKLSESNKNDWCLATTRKNLGTYYFYLKDYSKAFGYYDAALRYWQLMGDHEERCGILNNLGNTMRQKGRFREAEQYYGQALDMAGRLGSRYLYVVLMKNIGVLNSRQGKTAEAHQLLNQAVALANEYGLLRVEMDVLSELARNYYQSGNFRMAYETVHQYEQARDSLLRTSRFENMLNLMNAREQDRNERRLEDEKRIAALNKVKTERNYLYLLITLLVFVSAILTLLLKNKAKQKINRALQAQNDEIQYQRDELDVVNRKLQETRDQLEELVKSRTRELQRTNELLLEEIEERKHAVQSLHEYQSYLMELLNGVADPLFVKDSQHRWILLNDACCRLIGVSREELIGKSDYDFFPKEQADVFWEKDDEVLNTGKENVNVENITSVEGTLHIIETKKKRFINGKGERILVGIISDITEEKRLQDEIVHLNENLENLVMERTHTLWVTIRQQEELTKELKAEKERAEESDKLKSNFLSNLSHELRTPIMGILGSAEILSEIQSEGESGKMISNIRLSVNRLLKSMDAIILYSELTSDQISVKPVLVDLSALVTETARPYSIICKEKGVRFKLNMQHALEALADKQYLEIALREVLDNAVKFTEAGQINLTITDQYYQGFKGRLIQVHDTGIGIRNEDKNLIFDGFRQVSEGWGRHYEGNGLGLTIAKKLLQLMFGEIMVESEPGKGSVFSIWLPVQEQ